MAAGMGRPCDQAGHGHRPQVLTTTASDFGWTEADQGSSAGPGERRWTTTWTYLISDGSLKYYPVYPPGVGFALDSDGL
jgi:hypothetical protein